MDALFIGQTYIDVTFIADRIPVGDEKDVARDYAVSFGGNAVTAAFCCAKLGVTPDLLTTIADDWLGHMFLDMASRYQLSIHSRKVKRSSLSFVMPHGNKRAILRMRDDDFLHPFPNLNLSGCRVLHLDGHQGDAAIHYAKACREIGTLTSLDGGAIRSNTLDLLSFIDVAVISERMCEQLKLSPKDALGFLREKGCKVGAVTLGERPTRSWTPTARATCSTAPMCFRI
jgi:sulfofructose kinase